MLSVFLSCSSTNNITDAVIPELGTITSKLDNLVSALARANVSQNFEEASLPRTFQNADMQHHNQRLRDSAGAVLSVASTTIGLGPTQEDGSQYIPNTFSEFGVPLGNARRVAIEEWSQSIEVDKRDIESPRASSDLSMRSSTPTGQYTKSMKGPNPKPEDDIELYVVRQAFDKAEQNWFKADYAEAEIFFRAGMDRVNKLPPIKQQIFDLRETSLKIAFTCLHQKKIMEANDLFEPLLRSLKAQKGVLNFMFGGSPTTDEILYTSYAYFGLAQVHLCRGRSAKAELMCEKRNKHWKTTMGTKVDPLRYESLQLMALIHELNGNSPLATIFSELAVAEGSGPNETTPYLLPAKLIREIYCMSLVDRAYP